MSDKDSTVPVERCACGKHVLERWCGTYSDHEARHTRRECKLEPVLITTATSRAPKPDEAIARLKARVAELEKALYPLVVGCLEADAREDAPEFVNGEAERGRDALPKCGRCGGCGALGGVEYVDVVIPEAVRCPDCEGWGFLKHATASAVAPPVKHASWCAECGVSLGFRADYCRKCASAAAPQEPDGFDYDDAARQFFRDTVTEHENYYATHWTDETTAKLADAMRKVALGEMPEVTLYVQREQEPDAVAAAKERVVEAAARWYAGDSCTCSPPGQECAEKRGCPWGDVCAELYDAAYCLRAAEQAAGRREDDDERARLR